MGLHMVSAASSPFASTPVSSAQELGPSTDQVATFDELKSWLNSHMSTGGTVSLIDDITVPADQYYTYINGRYRKEIQINAGSHTIYIQGYLELWPFLSITGTGGSQGIFHILPGGRLDATSISIAASQADAIAIVQEPGAILVRSDMGFEDYPPFSCQGQILASQQIVAEPNYTANPDQLPVVIVPAGKTFSPSMLPSTVDSSWYDGTSQHSDPLPVIWDTQTFPHKSERTLVSGCYSQDYLSFRNTTLSCLVVFAQENAPLFLNSYASTYRGSTTLFITAFSPIDGQAALQGSYDGETWELIEFDTFKNGSASWQIYFGVGSPVYQYFSIAQASSDGSTKYSDILELTEDSTFVASEIGGGRGGETPPNEGETQLPPLPSSPSVGSPLEETPSPSSEPIPGSLPSPSVPAKEQTISGGNMSDKSESTVRQEISPTVTMPAQQTPSPSSEQRQDQPAPSADKSVSVPQEQQASVGAMPAWLQILIGAVIVLVILLGVLWLYFHRAKSLHRTPKK